MRTTYLSTLHCPYSGSRFEIESFEAGEHESIRYGLVRSEAGEFPIIDGILRLLIDELREPVVRMVRQREFERALLATLEVPHHERGGAWLNMAGRMAYRAGMDRAAGGLMGVKRGMYRLLTDNNKTFTETAQRLSSGPWSHWQLYRFSMPTFLPVFPLVHLLRQGPILDFGCGLGHAAFLMKRHVPGAQITGVDYSFSSLYLARKFFVSDANFVCLDGDYPLPFASGSFRGIFSSDALHCLDSKVTLAAELLRALSSDGTIVMPHLHNRLSAVRFGKSLSPDGYRRLFREVECRVLPEDQIVTQYLKNGELDLSADGERMRVDAAQGLSLIASRDPSVFRRYQGLRDNDIDGMHNPVLNPIYRATQAGGTWRLSRQVADWCAASISLGDDEVLPAQWELQTGALDRQSLRALKEQDRAAFSMLARKLVVVDAPAQYL